MKRTITIPSLRDVRIAPAVCHEAGEIPKKNVKGRRYADRWVGSLLRRVEEGDLAVMAKYLRGDYDLKGRPPKGARDKWIEHASQIRDERRGCTRKEAIAIMLKNQRITDPDGQIAKALLNHWAKHWVKPR